MILIVSDMVTGRITGMDGGLASLRVPFRLLVMMLKIPARWPE